MATEKWKKEHVEEMRAYRRKHYHTHKKQYTDRVEQRKKALQKFIAELKAKLKCSRCPETDHRCLDFHHKDPDKKEINISEIYRYGWSIKKTLKEIEKCIVLCSNCHRKEHMKL